MSSHPTPPHQPHPYSCVLASIPPVPSIHVLVVEQVAPEECDRDAQHAREEALLPDVRTVVQAGWEGEVRLPRGAAPREGVWCAHSDSHSGAGTRGGASPGTPKEPLP